MLYTGHICYPPWGIPLQPAKHEALISYDTFTKIQERLNGNARAPTRKDIHPVFRCAGLYCAAVATTPLRLAGQQGGMDAIRIISAATKVAPNAKSQSRRR